MALTSKYALLVGCNYIGTDYELNGCINDAIMLRKYLIDKRGYSPENITMLRDDNEIFSKPTKQNIVNGLNNLIKKANDDNTTKEIFFAFSGHGTYIKDTGKDERDGKDEVVYTLDDKYLVDDELRTILLKLDKTVTMYAIMDCCHSGTIVDLPYVYTISGGKVILSENNSTQYKSFLGKKICMISGCLDNQTSADAYGMYVANPSDSEEYRISNSNLAGGALTANLLYVLYNNPKIDISESLPLVRLTLKMLKFTQFPLLSTSWNLFKKDIISTSSNTPVSSTPQSKPNKIIRKNFRPNLNSKTENKIEDKIEIVEPVVVTNVEIKNEEKKVVKSSVIKRKLIIKK